jgi:hypothetical protein
MHLPWPPRSRSQQEEEDAVQLDADERNPEDDAVRALDSNSEQEDTNAHLQANVGKDVGRFT